MLGEKYQKSEIDHFLRQFNGKVLWIRGKELKGKPEIINPFEIV